MRYRQARQYTPRIRQHSRQGADSTADREPAAQQTGSRQHSRQGADSTACREHRAGPRRQAPPSSCAPAAPAAPASTPAAPTASAQGRRPAPRGPAGRDRSTGCARCLQGQRRRRASGVRMQAGASAVQQKFSWQGTRQGTALPVAYLLWRCREGRALGAPPPPRMRLQQSRAGPPRRPVAARQLRLCCS